MLYAGADQIEVECELDMHEKHRMLKLCFPTAGKVDVAEIPYGSIERRMCGDEEPCQNWVAMQGEDCGLAMLNDGKYSYSAIDGELRMTVANTSIFADHYGQKQRDDACRYMDMGAQRFRYALVPYGGSWKDAKLSRRAAVLNRPLTAIAETYHTGALGSEMQGISIGSDSVNLGAIKRSEDGKGIILRLAESAGRAQTTRVDFALAGRMLDLAFVPYEIKTVYVPDDPAADVREVRITEIED
jgi:alpha-mannosidase